jgi:hypothetical protein
MDLSHQVSSDDAVHASDSDELLFQQIKWTARAFCTYLRGGRSRDWNYCLALTHDLSTGITCAIIQGLENHEVDLLIYCLKSSPDHVDKPMLLPEFLAELKTHFFAVLLERRALSLEAIEYETGMSHGFSEDPKCNPELDAGRKGNEQHWTSIP